MNVNLDQLCENPDNPRIALGNIPELAASIAAVGLLQPLLVVAHVDDLYMVVDGHRRFAAMRSIDYDRPIPVVVDELDRAGRIVAAVSAGMFTQRLQIFERAKAFQQLRDELGLTQLEIANRVGCSIATVNTTLRVLELTGEARADLEAGRMSADQAIKKVRQFAPRPQGRKARVPNPEEHSVDFKLCLTVRPSTNTDVLGRDLAAWLEVKHANDALPHSEHILSIDDWGVSA